MKKKTTLIISFSLIAVILVLIFLIGYSVGNSHSVSQNSPYVTVQTMLLRDYDGRVALFKNNDERPAHVYNIYSETLPALDQKRLEKGIPISDKNELKLYIDDFDS